LLSSNYKKAFLLLLGCYLFVKLTVLVLPLDPVIKNKDDVSVKIYDRYRRELGEIFSADELYTSYIALNDLPQTFKEMLILSEDKRFYLHPGIDPLAIFRAVMQNLDKKKIVSGGSTITQQLARSYFSSKKRTVTRKIKEMVSSLYFELKYSKKQILEAYVNRAYFGYQNRGIAAAAKFYFKKEPAALSLREQTALIIIAKSPHFLYQNMPANRHMPEYHPF